MDGSGHLLACLLFILYLLLRDLHAHVELLTWLLGICAVELRSSLCPLEDSALADMSCKRFLHSLTLFLHSMFDLL